MTTIDAESARRLLVTPLSLRAANRFIVAHHRHNGDVRGWLFGTSLQLDGSTVAVAIAGRPLARPLQDGFTVELTRVCVDPASPLPSEANLCSRLYGRLCRAATALGYRQAITYTLSEEAGTSVRAAGFMLDTETAARPTWDGGDRYRNQVDLFGEQRRPPEAKVRWVRRLA